MLKFPNRVGCWFFLLTACLFSSGVTAAYPWSQNEIFQKPLEFVSGVAASVALHEASHWMVASSLGYQPKWDDLSIVYRDGGTMPDDDRLRIASAGLWAQWLATEGAFVWERDVKNKPDVGNFAAGIIVGEIFTTVAYLTLLKTHEEGDVHGIHEATELSHDQIAGLIAIPAILDAWRLFHPQAPKWLPVAVRVCKGIGVVFVWSY